MPGWPIRARDALRSAYRVAGNPTFVVLFAVDRDIGLWKIFGVELSCLAQLVDSTKQDTSLNFSVADDRDYPPHFGHDRARYLCRSTTPGRDSVKTEHYLKSDVLNDALNETMRKELAKMRHERVETLLADALALSEDINEPVTKVSIRNCRR